MGWFSKSPVRKLRDEYDSLIKSLDKNIKIMENNLKDIEDDSKSMHQALKKHSTAKGEMAELYYTKIEKSENNYKAIKESCENAISDMKAKRRRAKEIRSKLDYYYQREKAEDKEFKLGELQL